MIEGLARKLNASVEDVIRVNLDIYPQLRPSSKFKKGKLASEACIAAIMGLLCTKAGARLTTFFLHPVPCPS